jgi:hypothetical protein
LLFQSQCITILDYLHALGNGYIFENLPPDTNLFGEFIQSYKITTYGDTRRIIGKKRGKITVSILRRMNSTLFNRASKRNEALIDKLFAIKDYEDDAPF